MDMKQMVFPQLSSSPGTSTTIRQKPPWKTLQLFTPVSLAAYYSTKGKPWKTMNRVTSEHSSRQKKKALRERPLPSENSVWLVSQYTAPENELQKWQVIISDHYRLRRSQSWVWKAKWTGGSISEKHTCAGSVTKARQGEGTEIQCQPEQVHWGEKDDRRLKGTRSLYTSGRSDTLSDCGDVLFMI